jgi:hypothetical protein
MWGNFGVLSTLTCRVHGLCESYSKREILSNNHIVIKGLNLLYFNFYVQRALVNAAGALMIPYKDYTLIYTILR